MLNASTSEVRARLEVGRNLEGQREAVLGSLIQFLGSIEPQNDEGVFQLRLALSVVGEFNPDLGMSWAAAAHIEAGGSFDLPAEEDPLQAALSAMVRDVYALFLLPRGADSFAFPFIASLAAPLYRHPEREHFEAGVMADASLSRLFPEENEHSGRYGQILRSTGIGGTLQLSMFAEALMRNGWQLASLGVETPNPRHLFEKTLELLDVVRSAARGEQPELSHSSEFLAYSFQRVQRWSGKVGGSAPSQSLSER